MWKRRAEDAVHTILTDHKIQRIKPKRNFLASVAEKSPMTKVDKDLIFYGPQGLDAVEQLYFLGMAYLQLPPDQLAMSDVQRAKGVEMLQGFLTAAEQSEKQSSYTKHLSKAYLTLASFYRADGRRDLAFNASQRSLQYDSSFVLANDYNCGLLTELGKPEDALRCFERSLTINPWDARVYLNIGSLYAAYRSMDDAIRFFKLSLNVSPQNADAYHYLGDALAEKGDLKAAVASYETGLNLEPRKAEAYWDCALALQKAGENGLAVEYIRKGLQYAPMNPRGLELLSNAQATVSSPNVGRTRRPLRSPPTRK
jgi:tetratricopeptide (TPR) repeat protein